MLQDIIVTLSTIQFVFKIRFSFLFEDFYSFVGDKIYSLDYRNSYAKYRVQYIVNNLRMFTRLHLIIFFYWLSFTNLLSGYLRYQTGFVSV